MSKSFLQCRCSTCPRLRNCFSNFSNRQKRDTTELMPYPINTLTRTEHLHIFIQQSQLHWSNYPIVSAEGLEQRLVAAGPNHGRHIFQHLRFVPSRLLADLRLRRHQTNDLIREKLECLLGQFTMLKVEDFADNRLWNWSIGATTTAAIKFANMLEQGFTGNIGMPMGQPCLTKAPWNVAERTLADARLKAKGWSLNSCTTGPKLHWMHCYTCSGRHY